MEIIAAKDYEELSKISANIISKEIIKKPDLVLGLATGSTPIGTYKELIKKHKEEGLDFSEVAVFNLDEYYGLPPDHEQSYAYFMRENFFKHININMKNVYIPNGMTDNIDEECHTYDALIEERGGIDLQLLGIGVNGHIGFNEPDDELAVGTHLVNLTHKTIQSNSRFFKRINEVPKQAITMGVGSIMKAKKILLLAHGENKAEIMAKTISGKLNTEIPASMLQTHPKATFIIDEVIASYIRKTRKSEEIPAKFQCNMEHKVLF